jgi:hypothetical protein
MLEIDRHTALDVDLSGSSISRLLIYKETVLILLRYLLDNIRVQAVFDYCENGRDGCRAALDIILSNFSIS